MPAFVGPVDVNESEGIFSVGDAFMLSPKSAEKSSLGSGAGNTGDFIQYKNYFNITKFEDIDVSDQSDSANK
ncbi:spore germination protein [Metabacillus malikii]|uniref:Spore germination protein PF n=1 Tax=Metabacillus malikii TaxID=1504265 RepID=A0ABT9ZBX2_9BACI|nr:spore germination protein [Metabacillus malikii]MDQ0229765.1 spore germination protein PF [Metabacillus malikii]